MCLVKSAFVGKKEFYVHLLGCYFLSTGKTLPTLWKAAVVMVDPEDEAIMIFRIIRIILQ
jgi:hypothetical protein